MEYCCNYKRKYVILSSDKESIRSKHIKSVLLTQKRNISKERKKVKLTNK